MRAVQVIRLDGDDRLKVVDDAPEPADPRDVIIDVHAAGVGFPDLLMTKGQYQVKPQPPFLPGLEIAGVVRSAPAGANVKPGDRVAAMSKLGGWAEVAAAAPTGVFRIPESMTFAEATSFLNYQTAYFAFVWRTALLAGETVLIHGAAGGTGSAAIQVARGLGATVIAVAQGADKMRVARECGAHHALDADSDWLAETKTITDGRGVDIVFDPVGGDRFTDSVRSLATLGRLLVIGFAGGAIPEVKVNRLLLRNTAVIGVAWGEYVRVDPSMPQQIAVELAKMSDAGHIKPLIGGIYEMERVGDALRDLEQRRATGKLVVRVRD